MDELSFKCLLSADDRVVLAPSACGLQEVVNKVNDSVEKSGMTVNVGKTEMVFERGESATECDILIEEEKVEQWQKKNECRMKMADATSAQYVWSVFDKYMWEQRCQRAVCIERRRDGSRKTVYLGRASGLIYTHDAAVGHSADQCGRLQMVNEMYDCREHYERSLLQIQALQANYTAIDCKRINCNTKWTCVRLRRVTQCWMVRRGRARRLPV
ncbi:hypothetical protein EVAR_65637_1 [Eumeta japonica]|uniref:Reverse transcriptase domain-containing protein n=1 Tax=Eumeta variegata TaxID=151549 RepID=A0A4C1Z9F7_EUMVA|nr:hypothetical protein EVAR_65637_1 [Eumeta japonica]